MLREEERWHRFCSQYDGKEDKYGFSLPTFKMWEPFFRFLYEDYFRVNIIGLENIPDTGRAVLVGNHSGGLPIDAMMLLTGYYNHHPSPRRVRALAHLWLRRTSLISRVMCGIGAVPATFDTAVQLLNENELVMFYPEGAKGTGKLYDMRYRLYDFDPGFVKAAILTGAPIIPIVTIGGDDLYPILANNKMLARLLEMPYFPITPLFPWLPLSTSCLPLPAKILIKIGKPIYLPYPEKYAFDRKLRLKITRQIQFDIQRQINGLLRKRQSVF